MSQRGTSPDSVRPFSTGSSQATPAVGGPATPAVPPPVPSPLKVGPRAEPKLEFTPLEPRSAGHAPGHAGSGQPVVTMQRDGERVISIRIECPCGQVIDLACRYESNTLAP